MDRAVDFVRRSLHCYENAFVEVNKIFYFDREIYLLGWNRSVLFCFVLFAFVFFTFFCVVLCCVVFCLILFCFVFYLIFFCSVLFLFNFVLFYFVLFRLILFCFISGEGKSFTYFINLVVLYLSVFDVIIFSCFFNEFLFDYNVVIQTCKWGLPNGFYIIRKCSIFFNIISSYANVSNVRLSICRFGNW